MGILQRFQNNGTNVVIQLTSRDITDLVEKGPSTAAASKAGILLAANTVAFAITKNPSGTDDLYSPLSTEWMLPRRPAKSIQYSVKAVFANGILGTTSSDVNGSALSTWLSLGSDRQWYINTLSLAGSGAQNIEACNLVITIAKSDNLAVELANAVIYLESSALSEA